MGLRLYGAFATVIAAAFFPEADPASGLLAAFAVFGVAVGGEYGGSAAFVIEYAPVDRRCGYGGWQWATVAFNIVFVFLPSHLATAGRAPLSRALAAALVGLLVAAGTVALAGGLSDRIGRRPLLLAGVVTLLALVVPVTALLLRGEPGGLVLGYSLIGLALGALVPSTFLAELFPTRLRHSGLSLTTARRARSSAARPQPWRPSWSDAPATPSRPPGTPPR